MNCICTTLPTSPTYKWMLKWLKNIAALTWHTKSIELKGLIITIVLKYKIWQKNAKSVLIRHNNIWNELCSTNDTVTCIPANMSLYWNLWGLWNFILFYFIFEKNRLNCKCATFPKLSTKCGCYMLKWPNYIAVNMMHQI